MKYKAKLFGIYLPVFVIFTLTAVVLRSVACFTQYNFTTDYFNGKGLIYAADYITACACVFYFTYVFTTKKDIKLIPSFTSPATYIPTGLVAVALLFIAKSLMSSAISFYKRLEKPNLIFIVSLLASVFALLSILHFTLTAVDEKEHSNIRASFGLFTIIFLAFYSAFLYFDTNLPLNAPTKITDQMAYLFSALFFLYETRLSLGREKWRGYISFGFIAAMLTAYSSIPSLLIFFFKNETISNTVYESVLTFALFIFITARLLLTGELIADVDSDTASALKAAAEERDFMIQKKNSSEVDETVKETEETLDNQITISDIKNTEDDETETEFPSLTSNEHEIENENYMPTQYDEDENEIPKGVEQ